MLGFYQMSYTIHGESTALPAWSKFLQRKFLSSCGRGAVRGMYSYTSPNALRQGWTGKQDEKVLHPKQASATHTGQRCRQHTSQLFPSPWGRWWADRRGGGGTNADTSCRSSVGGWKWQGSSLPGWVFSRPPPQPRVAAWASPSCRPDPAALGGGRSWTPLRKTSSGMLSVASSVMQPGSLQLGSKVSWLLATSFTGAQRGTKGSLCRNIILCGLLVIWSIAVKNECCLCLPGRIK